MKLFAATAFLASLVSTAFAGPLDDFGLGTSTDITYEPTTNTFSIVFVDGAATQGTQQFGYQFYKYDCETALGVDETTYGFTNAAFGNTVQHNGAFTPMMDFEISMSAIKLTDSFVTQTTTAEIQFCVRNMVSTSDGSIEVNFQESQIIVGVDLTTSFVTSTSVAKRDKNAETTASEVYTITTELCDATPQPLKQGDLITVCMEPSSSDVVIASLTSFTWTQTVTNIEQLAVNPADTAANALSSAPTCTTDRPTVGESCKFSSVLKADFYTNPVLVNGAGAAVFELNRRRLNAGNNNEAEARLLQGLEGDVNVAVPLENTDTGPGALKTAGGASFGTALASGVALLSAALLA